MGKQNLTYKRIVQSTSYIDVDLSAIRKKKIEATQNTQLYNEFLVNEMKLPNEIFT